MESTPLASTANDSSNNNNNNSNEICQRYCRQYRHHFRDVPYISSEEFVELFQTDQADCVLVDVRTDPERQVSMLEGALTMDQFQHQIHVMTCNDNASVSSPEAPKIITYCTIGYRSGLEARRLGLQYPHLKHRLCSLDGIVSYTHALGKLLEANNTTRPTTEIKNKNTKDDNDDENMLKRDHDDAREQTNKSNDSTIPRLVNPQTGEPTDQVHTFGKMWSCVDDEHFQATHFSLPELPFRLFQVLVIILSCLCLRLRHCWDCFSTPGNSSTLAGQVHNETVVVAGNNNIEKQ